MPFKGTDFTGRSDYGPFIAAGIPSGVFTGAEGIKTAAEAVTWGGTAGQPYDPCYHLACDTYANNNDFALDKNSDAIAYAVLQYAMNKEDVNGVRGKGNFQLTPGHSEDHRHDAETKYPYHRFERSGLRGIDLKRESQKQKPPAQKGRRLSCQFSSSGSDCRDLINNRTISRLGD